MTPCEPGPGPGAGEAEHHGQHSLNTCRLK